MHKNILIKSCYCDVRLKSIEEVCTAQQFNIEERNSLLYQLHGNFSIAVSNNTNLPLLAVSMDAIYNQIVEVTLETKLSAFQLTTYAAGSKV